MIASSLDDWQNFRKWWTRRDPRSETSLENYALHPLLNSAADVAKSAIGVIHVKSMRYLYMSPNVETLFGWSHKEYMSRGVEFAFEHILPTDRPAMIWFSELINSFFHKLSEGYRSTYRDYWDYSIGRPDGSSIKVFQQDSVLKYDQDGQIEEFLIVCSRIGDTLPQSCQHLRLSAKGCDSFYKYSHGDKNVVQLEGLSKRELQVASLIAQSKSLKQIAEELNISFNTVKVHSTNILRKLKSRDSLEMNNLLSIYGYL